MSAILGLIISHLITIAENELVKEEPALVALVEQELRLLINKLESLLSKKAPQVAIIANPVLNVVSNDAVKAIDAASNAVMTPQSIE